MLRFDPAGGRRTGPRRVVERQHLVVAARDRQRGEEFGGGTRVCGLPGDSRGGGLERRDPAAQPVREYLPQLGQRPQGETEHPWPTPWGVMPKLDPCDIDSLGERIQRALPATKVVMAGDHADAKQQVTDLLKAYG